MRVFTRRALLASALVGAATPGLRAQATADEFVRLEPVLRTAMAKAAPFVVTVETFGGMRRILRENDGPKDGGPPSPPPTPQPPPPEDGEQKRKPLQVRDPGFHQAQGRSTGIVVGADGWVLVSRFCLNYDPTTILVTVPGGQTLHAARKGEDTSRGIALLKMEAQGLPVATFVDPATVRVGQWAFALGRTFGFDEPTVHIGIISARRRQYGRALQIDAYTSPANYGGAVIDIDGNVLGIAVPLSPSGRDAGVEWYDSGIGFCTTVADIAAIVERMKSAGPEGRLHRGWLGVILSESHLGPGARLTGVPKDGPAAAAGLRKGDTILRIDGIDVHNGPHLQMLLGAHMGGENVRLQVQKRRSSELFEVTVVLHDLPTGERTEAKADDLPATFPLPEKEGGR